MTRRCGNCTLCCRLLPQRELNKAASQRCEHQRHTGCKIYDQRPSSCRLWSCRWLVEDDTATLRRPDFSHYVIDIMPDFITATEPGKEPIQIPVVQVWVDPRYPEAHRDPELRAFIARRGEEAGMAALIRYSSSRGFVLFPPALTGGDWIENRDGVGDREHTAAEVYSVVPDQLAKAVGSF